MDIDQPKQIYRCDFTGCDREFVRADLCARHKERHTAKGSHLQRKDAFMNSHRTPTTLSSATSPTGTRTIDAPPTETNHAFHVKAPSDAYFNDAASTPVYKASTETPHHNVMSEMSRMSIPHEPALDPQLSAYNTFGPSMNGAGQAFVQTPMDGRRFSYDGNFSARPASALNSYSNPATSLNPMQPPPPISSPPISATAYPQAYPSPTSTQHNFRSPTNFSTLPQLPPFGFPQGYGAPSSDRSGSIMSPPSLSSMGHYPMPNSVANSIADFNAIDQMTTGYMMPVFGQETYNRSPSAALDENLLTMLFNTNSLEPSDPSPPEPEQAPPQNNMPLPKVEPDGRKSETPTLPSLSSGLDINIRESNISESKQKHLFRLVNGFHEIEHNEGRRSKAEILAGTPDDPEHAMSLPVLKTYLSSYWYHIHQQMPILHRPTFNPETCPDLLLLAMMCLGASCLERVHPWELTQHGAELAFFVAYHIRWEVSENQDEPVSEPWRRFLPLIWTEALD